MKRVKLLFGISLALLGNLLSCSSPALAANGDFALQVSPSPLVATVKPGVPSEFDLKIRNAGLADESLKIEPRSFTYDSTTGKIQLQDTTLPIIAPWVSFSAPTFTVHPGEWYTQKVKINLPKDTGFSYSFALLINRVNAPTPTGSMNMLRGAVTVFALINVDRPGATRSLELTSASTSRNLYEYLPATVDIRLKNTGNTIAQPYGNVFVTRAGSSKTIATLSLNDTQAYILPGTERTFTASWNDGFPFYQTDSNGNSTKTSLNWNFDHLSHFRIGRYTAKIVAVYNDGTRDVPITREVSFWVIPWKAILLILVVIAALVMLLSLYIRRRTKKAVQRALRAAQKNGDA